MSTSLGLEDKRTFVLIRLSGFKRGGLLIIFDGGKSSD